MFIALFTGGRIQTLPSGRVRVVFKWQYLLMSLLAAIVGTFIVMNTTLFSWNNIDQSDEETIFAPFTSRKDVSKWRNYITNQVNNQPETHPKLYYPRNCPHFEQHSKSCAKPVPSFIFAGSEFAGASYVFQVLKHHPQVAAASVDNSNEATSTHIFDKEEFDEANAFEFYISQFPFLKDNVLATMEEKNNWIVGENAPHYLYKSHLQQRESRIIFLTEPIARAHSQYLYEKSAVHDSKLTFETLIDLELPILRRCGHTSTQTGWEGFVACHQGSEIRASWKVSNDTHAFNSLAKGMYYPALVPFLQHFPSSQIFIMRTEDILLNPSSSFQRLAQFLDIDPTYFAERNFYQDEHLSEEELISTVAPTQHDNSSVLDHTLAPPQTLNTFIRPRQHVNNRVVMANTLNQPFLLLSSNNYHEEPELSTRYRLQRVFRHLNDRLLEIFDYNKTIFCGWVYDVDRG
ncbi:unnamed protein product [Mucor hiemalis]